MRCVCRAYGPLGAGDDVGDQYSSGVELLAAGRMAEVFVIDDERVVKLDRLEWNGVSALESDAITRVAENGLPVARSHGVITVDGRCGVVLDRLYGPSLHQVVIESAPVDIDSLAEQFAALHASINAAVIGGLPDLVDRLRGEVERSGLPSQLVGELSALLTHLDDGTRRVCHYDFHPDNVIVTVAGWIVIDWLGVASGPPLADLARTLLLGAQVADARLSEIHPNASTARFAAARRGRGRLRCVDSRGRGGSPIRRIHGDTRSMAASRC